MVVENIDTVMKEAFKRVTGSGYPFLRSLQRVVYVQGGLQISRWTLIPNSVADCGVILSWTIKLRYPYCAASQLWVIIPDHPGLEGHTERRALGKRKLSANKTIRAHESAKEVVPDSAYYLCL